MIGEDAMATRRETEGTITDLLATKHSEDVFVPQCKTGSSYGSYSIMDVWVMKASWAKRCTWVYEIKVDRSDFLNDRKWMRYLPYCNEFYFVCPAEMIARDEVPAEAGLMWVAKTGTRLYTKKKGPYRQVEIPEDLYRYLLMWRFNDRKSQLEYWKGWLEMRREGREIGHRASKEIARKYAEDVLKIQCENTALKSDNQRLQAIKDVADELGIHLGCWDPKRAAREKLTEVFDFQTRNALKTVISAATKLLEAAGEKQDALSRKRA